MIKKPNHQNDGLRGQYEKVWKSNGSVVMLLSSTPVNVKGN